MEDELSVEDDVLSDLMFYLIVNSEIPFCGPNATAKRVTCPHDKRIRSLYHCGSCLDPICAKHQFILCHKCYQLNHTHITENKSQK